MKAMILLMFAFALAVSGCADMAKSLEAMNAPTTTLTRDVRSVELTRYEGNTRIVLQVNHGWVEADETNLYIRFNATPVLSEQADKALRGMFQPCRYVGVYEFSIQFRCQPAVKVYPDVTRDYVDLVFVP